MNTSGGKRTYGKAGGLIRQSEVEQNNDKFTTEGVCTVRKATKEEIEKLCKSMGYHKPTKEEIKKGKKCHTYTFHKRLCERTD